MILFLFFFWINFTKPPFTISLFLEDLLSFLITKPSESVSVNQIGPFRKLKTWPFGLKKPRNYDFVLLYLIIELQQEKI